PGGEKQHLDCQECFIAAIDGPDEDRLWSFGREGVAHHPATSAGFEAAEALAIPSSWGDSVCASDGEALPAVDFGARGRDRDPPAVGDVDADGHLDVLVFAKRCDKGVQIREAVVFFNDGAGGLSFDRTMRITGSQACQAE